MNLTFRNKVIVITGGYSPLSEALARLIEAADGQACIIDKLGNKQSISSQEEEIKAKTIFLSTNDAFAEKKAIQEIVELFGKIDAVINSAYSNNLVSVKEGSYTEFMDSLHQNLSQDYKLTQEALPYIKLTKGTIINLVFEVSPKAQTDSSGQAAANGIRISFTEEWAKELKQYQISVNGVIVNYDSTNESHSEKDKKSGMIFTDTHQYTYSYTSPYEESAQIILYLLSENAKGITGQFIHVGRNVHLNRNMN